MPPASFWPCRKKQKPLWLLSGPAKILFQCGWLISFQLKKFGQKSQLKYDHYILIFKRYYTSLNMKANLLEDKVLFRLFRNIYIHSTCLTGETKTYYGLIHWSFYCGNVCGTGSLAVSTNIIEIIGHKLDSPLYKRADVAVTVNQLPSPRVTWQQQKP